MAYIGQQPVVGRYILLDQISGGFNGTTSGFTMSTAGGVQGVNPGLAQNVLLSLGGVIQQPGVDYTISGSGITFTTPPVSGTTFFATVLGDAQSVGTPSDGTVTPASIASGFDFGFPNVNVTGVITIASGVAATPSLSITGDADTGLYSPAVNTIAVTTSGNERMQIDSSGRLLVGTTSARSIADGTPNLQVEGIAGTASLGLVRNQDNSGGSNISFAKSRGTSLGANDAVQDNDTLGTINFAGADGTDINSNAASIKAEVDGTPGSNDMPGRLVFSTTADSASSPTERMRIDSSGRLLVGDNSSEGSNRKLQVAATDASAGLELFRYVTNAASAPSLTLSRSNSDTLGTNTLVDNNDAIGYVQFKAANGSAYNTAAQILAEVDGTPAADDMPGRLLFSTTADDASSPTERMRIDSSGTVKIGSNTLVAPDANADNLVIDTGDVDSGISILSATTGRIYFGDAEDHEAGSIRYVHTDNSLRFETANDEALRIDDSQRLLIGLTSSTALGTDSYLAQIKAAGASAGLGIIRTADSVAPPFFSLCKSRNDGIVESGDGLGKIQWIAHDGNDYNNVSALINAEVDGTPGGDDVPGRLMFHTTADGETSPTERVRITSDGTIQLRNSPGIDFSQIQTNVGGMTSETLDSYEEGTFEPTFTSTAGDFTSVTYNADTGGRYVKIGSVVTVNGCARCTAINTSNRSGSDTLCIGGLPFANTSRTNGDNADSLGALRVPVWGNTDNCPHIIQARQNQTFCTLINLRINNVHSTNLVSQANNSMMVQFSLTYRTA